MSADELDVARDAVALVRAWIERDREALEAILDHADLRAVAEYLAGYAGALGVEVSGEAHAVDFLARWQRQLAESEAAP